EPTCRFAVTPRSTEEEEKARDHVQQAIVLTAAMARGGQITAAASCGHGVITAPSAHGSRLPTTHVIGEERVRPSSAPRRTNLRLVPPHARRCRGGSLRLVGE